jgi:hypothetical protein
MKRGIEEGRERTFLTFLRRGAESDVGGRDTVKEGKGRIRGGEGQSKRRGGGSGEEGSKEGKGEKKRKGNERKCRKWVGGKGIGQ